VQRFNAEYRRQIAKLNYAKARHQAQAGHVTGGKVFGYDNVQVDGHVERRINELQADVVRRIFPLYVVGTGYARIAKTLNAEHALAPRPQQQRRLDGVRRRFSKSSGARCIAASWSGTKRKSATWKAGQRSRRDPKRSGYASTAPIYGLLLTMSGTPRSRRGRAFGPGTRRLTVVFIVMSTRNTCSAALRAARRAAARCRH